MATEVSKIEGEGLMDRVVRAVIKRQGDLNDSQMAKKLGISHVMWGYLKSGQRQPGMKFYAAIMREFPELIPDALIAIRERGTNK